MKFLEYIDAHQPLSGDIVRDLCWLGCEICKCGKFDFLQTELSQDVLSQLDNGLKKLQNNMPLAYLVGHAPFFGLEFSVSPSVLIPRMETEQLVEKIIEDNKNKNGLNILDLCTGSGCIAITLKKHLDCNTTAVDKSDEALKIAQQNAKQHNVDINFLKSDMFQNVKDKFDIVVSNPPYIATKEISSLPKSVKDFEPTLALDGGDDGLLFYKQIAENAPNVMTKNGVLYLEIGFDQGQTVPNILSKNFEQIQVFKDYDQHCRMVKCIRR